MSRTAEEQAHLEHLAEDSPFSLPEIEEAYCNLGSMKAVVMIAGYAVVMTVGLMDAVNTCREIEASADRWLARSVADVQGVDDDDEA